MHSSRAIDDNVAVGQQLLQYGMNIIDMADAKHARKQYDAIYCDMMLLYNAI
jgi:hypothetical protein